jgi:hypothetical protein
VKLDVNMPFTRVVGLHLEGTKRMNFRLLYGKLPPFCKVCGLFMVTWSVAMVSMRKKLSSMGLG